MDSWAGQPITALGALPAGAATQRKLDEVLRVLPDADNSQLTPEHASDSELQATRRQHRNLRETALYQSFGSGDHELMLALAPGD